MHILYLFTILPFQGMFRMTWPRSSIVCFFHLSRIIIGPTYIIVFEEVKNHLNSLVKIISPSCFPLIEIFCFCSKFLTPKHLPRKQSLLSLFCSGCCLLRDSPTFFNTFGSVNDLSTASLWHLLLACSPNPLCLFSNFRILLTKMPSP